MYSPPYNRPEDRAEILAFMRANDFPLLVTGTGGTLHASHLPVVVQEHGEEQSAMARVLRRRGSGRVLRPALVRLAALVRAEGARPDLELCRGPRVRHREDARGQGREACRPGTARRDARPAMAARVPQPARAVRYRDARRNRQFRDQGDATGDALEAFAEPGAARDGVDRRGARQVRRHQRASAGGADAQAFRAGVVRLFFALWPPAAAVAALSAWAEQAQV